MYYIRVPGMYDADEVSQETGVACLDDTLANQAEKEECDINTLVKRFGITGEVPQLERLPVQADFVGITDYHTAMNKLIEADSAFMELPADLRARFEHDAGKFVAFCSDEKNLDELRKLGLAAPAPRNDPLEVRVVPDAAAPAG